MKKYGLKINVRTKKAFLPVILAGMLFVAFAGGCGKAKQTDQPQEAQKSDTALSGAEEAKTPQVEGTIEQTSSFEMVFTGDFLLGNDTLPAYQSAGIDGILSPDMQKLLTGADFTMVNEEFPYGTGGTKAPDKQFTFQADPKYVSALTDMGVDLVSLANNHVLDYGSDVLSQTFTTLDDAGIDYVGAGESFERASACRTVSMEGTDVGILCASRVIPVGSWDVRNSQPGVFTTYDSADLVEKIKQADQKNDLVIVYVHWGIEKAEYPQDYQRTLAQEYIDAGADLVIGSHPHVLQGIEYYNGVPIVYSLGNFVFRDSTSRTAVLKVTVDADKTITLKLVAAAAANAKTYVLEAEKEQDVYHYIQSISNDVNIGEDGTVTEAAE